MPTLFAGNNSHVLRVDRVRDNDDQLIVDASVSATLYKNDGSTPVAGLTWPMALTHVLNGTYEGSIPADVAIVAGGLYVLEVIAQKGSTKAEWKGPIPARQRGFDD